MKKARTPWITGEIEKIVEGYLDILQIETKDRTFNKSKRNWMLHERLSRSRGSIANKQRNISAVMAMLGLPFMRGYKPAWTI